MFSLTWDPLRVDHKEQVVSRDGETRKMGSFYLKLAIFPLHNRAALRIGSPTSSCG